MQILILGLAKRSLLAVLIPFVGREKKLLSNKCHLHILFKILKQEREQAAKQMLFLILFIPLFNCTIIFVLIYRLSFLEVPEILFSHFFFSYFCSSFTSIYNCSAIGIWHYSKCGTFNNMGGAWLSNYGINYIKKFYEEWRLILQYLDILL